MTPLIQQLIALLQSIKPAPGTSSQAIPDLLRALAASVIQQDATQAQIPPGDFDPLVVEAIQAGAAQAAALNAAHSHLSVKFEQLPLTRPAVVDAVQRATEVFGPFVIEPGALLRALAFQTSVFQSVNAHIFVGPPSGEMWMLIPAPSTADSPTAWTLPAGTVWILSRFLVAGAPNMAGLRIAGGTLQFNVPVLKHGNILVPETAVWTLSVQPEQPAPGDTAGSDADALNLQLPDRLEVHSNAPPVLIGNVVLSGFGSDLNLTSSGAAFLDGNQISFPLQAAESQWSIAGNRSRVTQFSGESEPVNARWAIPVTITPTIIPVTEQLAEAAHGGSIIISFSKGLTSTLAGQDGGPCRWFAATLIANAERIQIQSLQPDSSAGYDLSLWETSLSELRLAKQPISRLFFLSERRGLDTVAVEGGTCANKWDLPRRADGKPFDFDGAIAVFGLVATPSSFFMQLLAGAPVSTDLTGLALENLYALVRPIRGVALIAEFDTGPVLPSGSANLVFDVDGIIPTLPDPYAANLNAPNPNTVVEGALRVTLAWTDSQRPALSVNLDKQVTFPEPRFDLLDDTDERAVYDAFQTHLASEVEFLYLLDMSSREHLFGVAFESPSDNTLEIIDNRLSLQLNKIRLLMQPQVLWEPVEIVPIQDVMGLVQEVAHSELNGGPTLVGANSVKLVPILPGSLSEEILGAIGLNRPSAALFSLPFGLRAVALLDQERIIPNKFTLVAPDTSLHEPVFDQFTGARQLRLVARNAIDPRVLDPDGAPDPARVMPGMMRQLANLDPGNQSGLQSVMPNELRESIGTQFSEGVPLHQADLSGYGLTTFSEWSQNAEPPAFTKVEFRVLNGRTAYEVIQFRSVLFECGARCVRTVILERHNSGRVLRIDTGWVALEPGLFLVPMPFEKGAVKAFNNIRRIRTIGEVIPVDATSVQPVIFDADADIDGAIGGSVPIYDRPGYIQLIPPPVVISPVLIPPVAPLSPLQLKALFDKVHAIGSPVDCAVRIGGTLQAQISAIVSDFAPDDNGDIGFAVAVVGVPKLPRAGQWTVVRIDPATQATTPVDPRRGVPMVRNGQQSFRFREPSDTRLNSARIEYALLMATDTCRALFRQPKIDPGAPGTISFDIPPLLADPYSLVQSTGAFPRANFGLPLTETPSFQITPDNLWRISDNTFTIATNPTGDFMKGGGWGMTRDYKAGKITLDINSAATAAFQVSVPPSVLNLQLPAPLGEIFQILTHYQAVDGAAPKLMKPDVVFEGALSELKDILDSMAHMLGLDVPFDISVTAGDGASPSFVVHMHLVFGIGDGPDGRAEIGMGKFSGQFLIDGELDASLKGVDRALLLLQFQGDVQQAILPPLLYGGGFFSFSIELRETGAPVVQLTLGMVVSIGGDLIPLLMELEATVKYGYSLIPETFAPGVLLGIEARAKILAGLIGFSFSVEVMAQIQRQAVPREEIVTISAQIHVAASVHVAIFLDEDVHFETQFQQDIPLATLGLLPGVGLLVAPALIPL